MFVEHANRDDGIGKLLSVDGKRADVEYFESPAGPVLRRVRTSIELLREVELSPQTRVFWFDTTHHVWRAGRVDGVPVSAQALKEPEDHYPVRFPNGLDLQIPVSQLYVRWAHPVEDPTDYLAARITDTPLFFDGRTHIVRYLANQRAAFGGLTGLASSAIELLEHQVSTVRRILADPVERYLLADEVGLGKTIEAGILIRQHVLDRPHEASVVVVVPEHLLEQWKSELAEKFFLTGNSPVRVVSEDGFCELARQALGLSMLVVDEAHRAALRAFDPDSGSRSLYQAIRSVAEKTPRVLLLSGTPVLHQEEGFLAMLHLLDPDGYPLSDREHFRRRVSSRQAVAEATLDLVDDASAYFAGDALERLERSFGDDPRLVELCQTVRERLGDDTGDSSRIRALRALRAHLTETYRLHRRLLRTRRDDPRVQVHLPRRTGAVHIQHEDQARREAFDFLEAWRLALSNDRDEQEVAERTALFSEWVSAALSHPLVLIRKIDARLASCQTGKPRPSSDIAKQQMWAFPGEQVLLEERRELILRAANVDLRVQSLVNWFRSNGDVKKAIVFVDDREIADHVAERLRNGLGPEVVIRHDSSRRTERTFEGRQSLSLLVCDVSAEEGLNLQRCGAALVHFDLPLEPARIEQRIGRVDRLEARGRLRNVVLTSGCPFEEEWFNCLDKSIGVFNRSIAPLQYSLLEAAERIRSRLLVDGRDAIEQESTRMGDREAGLDAELRRIRAQEAIDSVEGDAEADTERFTCLLAADEAAETTGEIALNAWVRDRLQFNCRQVEPAIIRYVHDVRRPTLVPLYDTASKFRECIDLSPKARDSKATLPLLPGTFSRPKAEEARVGLFRVGHPFLRALDAMVRSDDRGMAFAMWRYVPRSTRMPMLFFRFDFYIEANLSIVASNFSSLSSLESMRRRADEAFPVEYRTVWLDGDLRRVANPRLLAVLERPYHQQPRLDGSHDVNLRMERWERVDALLALDEWAQRCRRARSVAAHIVQEDAEFKDRCRNAAARVSNTASDMNESLKSRIARLDGSARDAEEKIATLEADLAAALAAGIETPTLRVDSAGAIVLASTRLED